MRLRLILTMLVLASLALGATAQQPVKPVQVDAPNVPGGKVVLVPRDQLRASPNTKTLRLPHPLRAALGEKATVVTPPSSFDWATKNGKRADLPMLGNDSKGDCYYVAPLKVYILMEWQNSGKQLVFDQAAVVRRYLQISGGDNGLSDSQVFPEMKAGIVGPNGPYKSLDELIVPASDKQALKLAAWAFGSPMFTFTVYQNFMNVAPGGVMTGNSGREVGGHAVLFSGANADGSWNGETWGFPKPFVATPQWIAGVDPEFVATFSLRWFNDKGYAPNGLHYTVLAPMWNSMGGNVSLVSPFPPPADPVVPPVDPVVPPATKGFSGVVTHVYVNGSLQSVTQTPQAKIDEMIRSLKGAVAAGGKDVAMFNWGDLLKNLPAIIALIEQLFGKG